jgi:multidrug efflux system outer membrane protein
VKRRHAALLLLGPTLALAGGPKYRKPDVNTPQSWQTPSPFHEAQPLDSLPRGAWWTLFGDAELNQYEERALANNQTLKAAIAR